MLRQDRLPVLMALYNRKLADVAAAAGMPKSTACELVNNTRPASPQQIARLERAIIGAPSATAAPARRAPELVGAAR